MKKFTFLFALLLSALFVRSQVVTVYPHFPANTDSLTVVFDATQGDAGMATFTGTVYAHTGVVLQQGTKTWSNTQDNWATADAKTQMKSLGNHKYSISYRMTNFYGIAANTPVYDLTFVFRDVTGNTTGRDIGGADIFYPLYNGQLKTMFLTPNTAPRLYTFNANIQTNVVSSENCTLTLYQNGVQAKQVTNADSIGYLFAANTYGKSWIKVVADNGTTTVADSFYYIVTPPITLHPVPAGWKTGINYLDDSTAALVFVAPYKNDVFVIGEFNNWQLDTAYLMRLAPDNATWWVKLQHLTPGKEYAYQFYVDGSLRVGDPYCEKVLDPNNDQYISATTYPHLKAYPVGQQGIVSVLQTARTPYPWKVTNFTPAPTASMVIYELWVNDFITAHSYNILRDSVEYLKKLGVNAIELLPINEFEGNVGLGYNPNYYFAPDKYYGPEDSLKSFIDYCHQNGIAVIQDIALNDCFGSCPLAQLYWNGAKNQPAANNPWLDTVPTHPYNVGSQINHYSPYTEKFFTDVTRHWLSEYKMDGFRFDLAKGYTQKNTANDVGAWGAYDQDRINKWKAYSDSIKSVFPKAIMILEYLVNPDNNLEAATLVNYGLLLWNWGGGYSAYEQAAMGYSSPSWDLTSASYKSFAGWNVPGQVNAMETHDQERVMFKVEKYGNASGTYNTKDSATGFDRISLCANLFFTVPGPDMVWEFGELGFDYSINWQSTANTTTGSNNDPKPIRWDYFRNAARYRTFRVFASLIKLKETMPAFSSTNFTSYLSGPYKQVELIENSGTSVVAMGNFAVTVGTNYGATFPHTGKWYEYYTGDSMNITTLTPLVTLNPGEYRLYTDHKLAAPDLGPAAGVQTVGGNNEKAELNIYPNPANNQTGITFTLPQAGKVQVEVFDLGGKRVDVLMNKTVAAGLYNTLYDTNKLTNGMYIVKVTTETQQVTGKINVQH